MRAVPDPGEPRLPARRSACPRLPERRTTAGRCPHHSERGSTRRRAATSPDVNLAEEEDPDQHSDEHEDGDRQEDRKPHPGQRERSLPVSRHEAASYATKGHQRQEGHGQRDHSMIIGSHVRWPPSGTTLIPRWDPPPKWPVAAALRCSYCRLLHSPRRGSRGAEHPSGCPTGAPVASAPTTPLRQQRSRRGRAARSTSRAGGGLRPCCGTP